MKWLLVTSRTLRVWALYICWNWVRGAGVASRLSSPKKRFSQRASVKNVRKL